MPLSSRSWSDPDRPLELIDPVRAAVDARLEVDGRHALAGDSTEVAKLHDRVLDASDRNPKCDLGTTLVPLGVDVGGGDPAAQLPRDVHRPGGRGRKLVGAAQAHL